MNPDDDFAKKITGYLDAGTAGMKPGTVYRLQRARQAALARMAGTAPLQQSHRAHAIAGTGGKAPSGGGLWTSARLWLGIVAIVAAGIGFQQWQVYQQAREIEELDVQLLSSDLPIDALLDRGFQNWLKRREP